MAVWRGKDYEDVCDFNMVNLCFAIYLEGKGDIEEFFIIKDSEVLESDLNLKELERKAILRALRIEGWNQAQAAKHLGISARNLHYKIHKIHKIRDERLVVRNQK